MLKGWKNKRKEGVLVRQRILKDQNVGQDKISSFGSHITAVI